MEISERRVGLMADLPTQVRRTWALFELHTRQCEIKDIKLCQVRTKIIALGWY